MATGAPLPATHREGPVAGAPEHWPAGWPRHQDQLCALSVPRALLSLLSTWEGSWPQKENGPPLPVPQCHTLGSTVGLKNTSAQVQNMVQTSP